MNDILSEIIRNLRRINTKTIILFGSYATNTHDDESDIDLVVILDSDDISKTYEERMQKKLLVRNCIYEQSRMQAIDLVVYTNAEYNIIKQNNTSFYQEIRETGRVIYEKAD